MSSHTEGMLKPHLFIMAFIQENSYWSALNNVMEKILNIRAHTYSKQILMYLKGEKDINTVIVCDFNPLLSIKDRSSRHKVKKEILDLNYALHQIDLMDTHGTFHLREALYTYTFFSGEQGTFPQIDHMLGHKSLKTSEN